MRQPMIKQMRGFTLVEIAIAMAVAGLLLAGSIYAYRLAVRVEPIQTTRLRFTEVELALSKFLALNGRLPCPARPDYIEGAANAGVEACRINATTPIPACDNSKEATTGAGLCYAPGRDANSDGVTTDDAVYVGSVPYVTLGLTVEQGNDGWNRKMKYVVSARLSSAATYDPDMGAIYVVNPRAITAVDGGGIITPNYRLASPVASVNGTFPYPYGSGQFYLMSFGENSLSAYVFTSGAGLANRNAAAYQCDRSMTRSNAFFGLDFENCNNDAYFFSPSRYTTMQGYNNRWYLDDIVHDVYRVEPYRDIESYRTAGWKYNGRITQANTPEAVKVMRSSARLGLGTATPATQVEVNGNVKLDRLRAEKVCDETGANCFSPAVIGATNGRATCGTGNFAGIVNGEPVCATATFSDITLSTCAAGQSVGGISAGGGVVCR